jgi:hypothetical protein
MKNSNYTIWNACEVRFNINQDTAYLIIAYNYTEINSETDLASNRNLALSENVSPPKNIQ